MGTDVQKKYVLNPRFKIAGPIDRFTLHLGVSKPSEVEPINLRKNDYFLELWDSFNEFIKRK